MKLTRYEFKRNPDGDRKPSNLFSEYLPPVTRIIVICVLYALLLLVILDIFIFNTLNLIEELTFLSVLLLYTIFVVEHNPLFIFGLMIRIIYYIFSKQRAHKKLVRYLLKDYRNVISIENKLNISNVKISFFNPRKIIYYKNGKRGSVSPKYVKLDGEILLNEYSNCENEHDYIKYLKITIKEIYKNFKEKKNSK